jgi:hypothetical protein
MVTADLATLKCLATRPMSSVSGAFSGAVCTGSVSAA